MTQKKILNIIFPLLFLLLQSGWAKAQERAQYGLFSSPSGFGARIYIPQTESNGFRRFTLYADCFGLFSGSTRSPGIKADYSNNRYLATMSAGNTSIRAFAGPGFSLGYVADYEKGFLSSHKISKNKGFEAALCGTGGIIADFPGNLSIAVDLTVEAGIHIRKDEEKNSANLSLYKNGLIGSLYPQLTVIWKPGKANEPFGSEAGMHLISFGVEWGPQFTFFEAYEHNYLTQDNINISDKKSTGKFHVNTSVLAFIGINFLEKANISLFGGIMGVNNGVSVYPVSLRGSWFFNGITSQGSFIYADGGVGLARNMSRKPSAIGKLAYGYRIPLGSRLKLDFSAGIGAVHDHPVVLDKETHTEVKPERIRKSDAIYCTAFTHITLSF